MLKLSAIHASRHQLDDASPLGLAQEASKRRVLAQITRKRVVCGDGPADIVRRPIQEFAPRIRIARGDSAIVLPRARVAAPRAPRCRQVERRAPGGRRVRERGPARAPRAPWVAGPRSEPHARHHAGRSPQGMTDAARTFALDGLTEAKVRRDGDLVSAGWSYHGRKNAPVDPAAERRLSDAQKPCRARCDAVGFRCSSTTRSAVSRSASSGARSRARRSAAAAVKSSNR